jgi:alpha-L-fucosidase 2
MEALPVGNGRIGAMIYGNPEVEHIQFNENTLYSGEPGMGFDQFTVRKDFPLVTGLIEQGKYDQARDFIEKNWLGRLHQCYQPFGDIYIESYAKGEITGYRRQLDISKGIVTVTYTQSGVNYKREYFVSFPDKVLVVRYSCDSPEGLKLKAWMSSEHPTASQTAEEGILKLKGQAPGHAQRRPVPLIEQWEQTYKHPEMFDRHGNRIHGEQQVFYGDQIDNKGTYFESQLKAIASSGNICYTNEGISVEGMREVVFLLTAATSFNGFDKSPSRQGADQSALASRYMMQASAKPYNELLRAHIADFNALFSRVSLTLPGDKSQTGKPTNERLAAYPAKHDPDLSALAFQMGRYVLICSSREGGQPANLMGIWNNQVIPPWNGAYTININIQMNYWLAEVTNIAECHEPLFTFISELAQSGTQTARKMYGARGWVAHHNTSIWRETYPNDGKPRNAFWNMSPGWFLSHMWEHYLFTGDREFLCEKAYPLMKSACEFYSDWLTQNKEGWFLTPVSASPESSFYLPGTKIESPVSPGCTMDMAILKELFGRTIATAEMLGVDDDLRVELQAKYDKLLPYKIGAKGQIQEWIYDFEDFEPHHRHLSHLYGVYPGNQITPETNPDLLRATINNLELRGDEGTGFSTAWKMCLWARLMNGDRAEKLTETLIRLAEFKNDGGIYNGGLFANMLSGVPYTCDGILGYTAGVAEMLLQSHAGYIQLLPALPAIWKEGEVKGMKARGNFEVGMSWKNGRLSVATIKSNRGGVCRVRSDRPLKLDGGKLHEAVGENTNPYFDIPGATPCQADENVVLPELPDKKYYTYEFDTEEGKTYTLQ